MIWIFAAIFAAACQTARSAFQKNMIPRLGDYGAAYTTDVATLNELVKKRDALKTKTTSS